MNRLTKIAIWLGLVGLGVFLLVGASGVHPKKLFFNLGFILVFFFFFPFFFFFVWFFYEKVNKKKKKKRKKDDRWLLISVLYFYFKKKKTKKLNKIAARWPAKAVTQFFFF